MRAIIALVLTVGLVAACASPAPDTAIDAKGGDPGQIEAGRQLAVKECSPCHAIDRNTASPLAGTPPLMTILGRYNSEALANDLIEGVRLGHDEMPAFDFNVIAADALIAYLQSIETPAD